MTKRKAISKKARFEVFKRDGFKCQYCGESAPDVILHVDHIHPVSKGGGNDTLNLVTSCAACNNGKSDNLLTDSTAIQKQREQLEELNERRNQLEMMVEWREGMKSIEDSSVDVIESAINGELSDFVVNDNGIKSIKKWLRKFPVPLILECIDISSEQYLFSNEDGEVSSESFEKFFGMIPRIAYHKHNKTALSQDVYRDAYYCRGILRKRFSYINESLCIRSLKEAVDKGVDSEILKEVCVSVRSWAEFRDEISALLEAYNA